LNCASLHCYRGAVKKGYGLDRALPVMDRSALESLPTGALLARLKRLRWCEESPVRSDLTPEQILSAEEAILFKSDPQWKSAYSDVREILAGREHIERRSKERR